MPDLFRDPLPPFSDPEQEAGFLDYYKTHATTRGLDPNPDNPLHQYDYRRAYLSGATPSPEDGHWPSEYKLAGHPNRFVDGQDTITGQEIVTPRMKEIIPAGTIFDPNDINGNLELDQPSVFDWMEQQATGRAKNVPHGFLGGLGSEMFVERPRDILFRRLPLTAAALTGGAIGTETAQEEIARQMRSYSFKASPGFNLGFIGELMGGGIVEYGSMAIPGAGAGIAARVLGAGAGLARGITIGMMNASTFANMYGDNVEQLRQKGATWNEATLVSMPVTLIQSWIETASGPERYLIETRLFNSLSKRMAKHAEDFVLNNVEGSRGRWLMMSIPKRIWVMERQETKEELAQYLVGKLGEASITGKFDASISDMANIVWQTGIATFPMALFTGMGAMRKSAIVQEGIKKLADAPTPDKLRDAWTVKLAESGVIQNDIEKGMVELDTSIRSFVDPVGNASKWSTGQKGALVDLIKNLSVSFAAVDPTHTPVDHFKYLQAAFIKQPLPADLVAKIEQEKDPIQRMLLLRNAYKDNKDIQSALESYQSRIESRYSSDQAKAQTQSNMEQHGPDAVKYDRMSLSQDVQSKLEALVSQSPVVAGVEEEAKLTEEERLKLTQELPIVESVRNEITAGTINDQRIVDALSEQWKLMYPQATPEQLGLFVDQTKQDIARAKLTTATTTPGEPSSIGAIAEGQLAKARSAVVLAGFNKMVDGLKTRYPSREEEAIPYVSRSDLFLDQNGQPSDFLKTIMYNPPFFTVLNGRVYMVYAQSRQLVLRPVSDAMFTALSGDSNTNPWAIVPSKAKEVTKGEPTEGPDSPEVAQQEQIRSAGESISSQTAATYGAVSDEWTTQEAQFIAAIQKGDEGVGEALHMARRQDDLTVSQMATVSLSDDDISNDRDGLNYLFKRQLDSVAKMIGKVFLGFYTEPKTVKQERPVVSQLLAEGKEDVSQAGRLRQRIRAVLSGDLSDSDLKELGLSKLSKEALAKKYKAVQDQLGWLLNGRPAPGTVSHLVYMYMARQAASNQPARRIAGRLATEYGHCLLVPVDNLQRNEQAINNPDAFQSNARPLTKRDILSVVFSDTEIRDAAGLRSALTDLSGFMTELEEMMSVADKSAAGYGQLGYVDPSFIKGIHEMVRDSWMQKGAKVIGRQAKAARPEIKAYSPDEQEHILDVAQLQEGADDPKRSIVPFIVLRNIVVRLTEIWGTINSAEGRIREPVSFGQIHFSDDVLADPSILDSRSAETDRKEHAKDLDPKKSAVCWLTLEREQLAKGDKPKDTTWDEVLIRPIPAYLARILFPIWKKAMAQGMRNHYIFVSPTLLSGRKHKLAKQFQKKHADELDSHKNLHLVLQKMKDEWGIGEMANGDLNPTEDIFRHTAISNQHRDRQNDPEFGSEKVRIQKSNVTAGHAPDSPTLMDSYFAEKTIGDAEAAKVRSIRPLSAEKRSAYLSALAAQRRLALELKDVPDGQRPAFVNNRWITREPIANDAKDRANVIIGDEAKKANTTPVFLKSGTPNGNLVQWQQDVDGTGRPIDSIARSACEKLAQGLLSYIYGVLKGKRLSSVALTVARNNIYGAEGSGLYENTMSALLLPSTPAEIWVEKNAEGQIVSEFLDIPPLGQRVDGHTYTKTYDSIGKCRKIIYRTLPDNMLSDAERGKVEEYLRQIKEIKKRWMEIVIERPGIPLASADETVHAYYFPEEQLAIFHETADAGTIIHEWLHHLSTHSLLPPAIANMILDKFGSVAPDGTKIMDRIAEEKFVDAFMLFLDKRNAVGGYDPEDEKAFAHVAAAIKKAAGLVKNVTLPDELTKLLNQITAENPLAEVQANLLMQSMEAHASELPSLLMSRFRKPDRIIADAKNVKDLYRIMYGAARQLGKVIETEDGKEVIPEIEAMKKQHGKERSEDLPLAEVKNLATNLVNQLKYMDNRGVVGDLSNRMYGKPMEQLSDEQQTLVRDNLIRDLMILENQRDTQSYKDELTGLISPTTEANERYAASVKDDASKLASDTRGRSVRFDGRMITSPGGDAADSARMIRVYYLWNEFTEKMKTNKQFFSDNFSNMTSVITKLSDGDRNGAWNKVILNEVMRLTNQHVRARVESTKFQQQFCDKNGGLEYNRTKLVQIGKTADHNGYMIPLSHAVTIYLHTRGDVESPNIPALFDSNPDWKDISTEQRGAFIRDAERIVMNEEAWSIHDSKGVFVGMVNTEPTLQRKGYSYKKIKVCQNFVKFVDLYSRWIYEKKEGEGSIRGANEAFRIVNGRDLGRLLQYFPMIRKNGKFDTNDILSLEKIVPSEIKPYAEAEPGSLKPRETGIISGRLDLDAISVLNRYMREIDAYRAKVPELQKLTYTLDSQQISSAVQDRYGDQVILNTLKRQLLEERYLTGNTEGMSATEKFVDYTRKTATEAYLIGNPPSIARQATAIPVSMAYVPISCQAKFVKYLIESMWIMLKNPMKGAFETADPFEGDQTYELMKKLDPTTASRRWEHGILDLAVSSETSVGLLGKIRLGGKSLSEWGLAAYKNVDFAIVRALWRVLYELKMSYTNDITDLTPEQKSSEAALYARKIVEISQTPAHNLARLGIQKHSAWGKAITMLTGQNLVEMLGWNDIWTTLNRSRMLAKKEGKNVPQAVLMGLLFNKDVNDKPLTDIADTTPLQKFAFTTIIPAMVVAYSFRMRPPEEDEWWMDIITYLFSRVPVIGPMFQSRYINEWAEMPANPIFMSLTDSLTQSAEETYQGKAGWKTFTNFARAGAEIGGVPMRIVSAIDKVVKGNDGASLEEVLDLMGMYPKMVPKRFLEPGESQPYPKPYIAR